MLFSLSTKVLKGVLFLAAGTSLLIMMILTFVDVFARYLFNNSIFGTAEIVEFLMVFTIFAGTALVTVQQKHITVSIFENWFTRTMPKLHRATIAMFSAAVYMVMTYQLAKLAIEAFRSDKRTAVLDWAQYLLPACGAVLSSMGVILTLLYIFRSQSFTVDTDDPDLPSFTE